MPLTLLLLLGAIWVPTGSWWRSRIGVDDSVWFSLAALPVALAFLLRVDHGALVDAKSSTMLLAIEGRILNVNAHCAGIESLQLTLIATLALAALVRAPLWRCVLATAVRRRPKLIEP